MEDFRSSIVAPQGGGYTPLSCASADQETSQARRAGVSEGLELPLAVAAPFQLAGQVIERHPAAGHLETSPVGKAIRRTFGIAAA